MQLSLGKAVSKGAWSPEEEFQQAEVTDSDGTGGNTH